MSVISKEAKIKNVAQSLMTALILNDKNHRLNYTPNEVESMTLYLSVFEFVPWKTTNKIFLKNRRM